MPIQPSVKQLPLLRKGNSDLKRDNIYVWSLPAWLITLANGKHFNTCPSAGVCAKACYARKGTYLFRNVRAAHTRNLEATLNDLEGWTQQMVKEVASPKFNGAYVRIHDGGDFYSADYLQAWLYIAQQTPNTTFYAYTKEVAMFKQIVEPNCPANFKYIYSYGGKDDHLITNTDRQCDVFPDEQSLINAGYVNQQDSDLQAITGHHKVGIVINNHAGAVKAMQGNSMREQQTKLHKQTKL